MTPEESKHNLSANESFTHSFMRTLSFRRFFSLIVAIAFVFTMVPPLTAAAVTAAQPGEIIISKTATPVSDDPDNREYTIEFSVSGTPLTAPVPTDVILVLDMSYSMDYRVSQGGVTRLQALKTAAKTFINGALDPQMDNKIAIVEFSGNTGSYYSSDSPYNDSHLVQDFSSNSTTLNGKIDGLSTSGGTNMQAGFMKAQEVFASPSARAGAQKMVVFITDGEPTYRYDSDGYTIGNGSNFSTHARDNAVTAANNLKNAYNNINIYTVGLIPDDSMTSTQISNVESVLKPDAPNNYQTQYFSPSTGSELTSVFTTLLSELNEIAGNAKLVDIVNEDFTIDPDSISGTYTVNADKITWDVGNIGSTPKTFSFTVVADDELYGAAYTNDEAWLYFDPIPANSFYSDSSFDNTDESITAAKRIKFGDPVVKVPPLAANDDFYEVKVGTTLQVNTEALSVLHNDPSAYKQTVAGWTTTDVEAVRISDPSQGSINSFDANGQFTYISNPNASGTDTFEYDIKTTVQHGDGQVLVLTDRALVTITILPAHPLTVRYQDKDSGDYLTAPDPDSNAGLAFGAGDTYTVDQHGFSGYEYSDVISDQSSGTYGLTGNMPDNPMTLTLRYTKEDVGSLIFYYQDSLANQIGPTDGAAGPSGKWGETKTLSSDQINAYLPDGYHATGQPADYSLVLDQVESVNVYRIIYFKNSYPYTVNYYYRNDLNNPFDSKTMNPVEFGTAITAVPDPVHTITTGQFVKDAGRSTALPYTIGFGSNLIKVVYESIPAAVNDQAVTDMNTLIPSINVLSNDSDILGDALTIDTQNYTDGIVSGVLHGTLQLNQDQTYSYQPDQGYVGSDSFVYAITDAYGQTAQAIVSITVRPWYPLTVNYLEEGTGKVLLPPHQESLKADTVLDITQPDIPGFISKGTLGDISIPSVMPEQALTITFVYERRSINYTVEHYYENSGQLITSESFSALFEAEIKAEEVTDYAGLPLVYNRFRVAFPDDGSSLIIGASAQDNLIKVYYAAAPSAADKSATINPNQSITINLLAGAYDPDGLPGELKLDSVNAPGAGNGTVSVNYATGDVTYTPAVDDHLRTISFAYSVIDKQNLTGDAVVTISIRDFFKLTVNYVDSDDHTIQLKKPLENSKMVYNQAFELAVPVIPGYALDTTISQELSGTMPMADVNKTLYFKRQAINYTVEHYYENSGLMIASESFSALFEAEIKAEEVTDYAGLPQDYNRFRVAFPDDGSSLIIGASAQDNLIKVYYAAAPSAADKSATINPNQSITINLLAGAADPDGLSGELKLHSVNTPGAGNGSVSVNYVTGDMTYTPAPDDNLRNISFAYSVSDKQNLTGQAVVTISIRDFHTLEVLHLAADGEVLYVESDYPDTKMVLGQSYDVRSRNDIPGYVHSGLETVPAGAFGYAGTMPGHDLKLILRYSRTQVGSLINYYYYDNGSRTYLGQAAGPGGAWGSQVELTQQQINKYLSGDQALDDLYYSPGLPADYQMTLSLDEAENIFTVEYKSGPLAEDDYDEVDLGEQISISVLDNDDDPDGDSLSIVEIVSESGPAKGTAEVSQSGSITYTHTNLLLTGEDSFDYMITDPDGNQSTATVYIYIHPDYPLIINYVDLDTGRLMENIDQPLPINLKRGASYPIAGQDHQITGFNYLGIVPTPDEQEKPRKPNLEDVILRAAASADQERLIPEDLDLETLLENETVTMREGGLTRYLVYQRAYFGYVVEYYYTGEDEPFASWQSEDLFENEVESYPQPDDEDVVYTDPSAEPIDLEVYYLDKVEGLPLQISEDQELNLIKVYYDKDPETDPTTLPTITVVTESIPQVPVETTVPTIQVVEEEIPQSGENAPIWPLGLSLVIIAGGLALLLHSSKRENQTD